jgi:hypothetical protein
MSHNIRRFFENTQLVPLLFGTVPATKTDLGWLDVGRDRRITFVIQLPALAADGEVTFVARKATKSDGTGKVDIKLGTVTAEISKTLLVGTPASMVWAAIEIDTEKLNENNSGTQFSHVTVAVQDVVAAVESPATARDRVVASVYAIRHNMQDRPVTQTAACKGIVYFDAAV